MGPITNFTLKALFISGTFVSLLLTERSNTTSVNPTFSEVTAEVDTIIQWYNYSPCKFITNLDRDRENGLVAISDTYCYIIPFRNEAIPKTK
ncbi:MAG: hypothetical protein GX639_11045 [Fibrobacter sp.]|nr:hypothetical protein [Fibrobacter sp.]